MSGKMERKREVDWKERGKKETQKQNVGWE